MVVNADHEFMADVLIDSGMIAAVSPNLKVSRARQRILLQHASLSHKRQIQR